MKETNIEVWERLLEDMPDSYRNWFKEEKKYLEEHISKDAKVLEVGCGEGRSIIDILDITKSIVGIDNDEKAIKDAKENLKDYSDVKIILADAKELPFENKFFDFVICMTTFANFGPDKFKVLEEMKRVLKDEGYIIISVFSEDALEERMKVYKKVGVKIEKIEGGTVTFEGDTGDIISEQFSKEQLVEIFTKVNLKIIDIKKKDMAYLCKLKK